MQLLFHVQISRLPIHPPPPSHLLPPPPPPPRMELVLLLVVLLLLRHVRPSLSGVQSFNITPGFNGTSMDWVNQRGRNFLLSPSKTFALGFKPTGDQLLQLLVVSHLPSLTVVWTANRAAPVSNSGLFLFDRDGDVLLRSSSDNSTVWSTNTAGKPAAVMKLRDDGNLVLLDADGLPLWHSFDHPTDTLLSGQTLAPGMTLVSDPNSYNLTFRLKITSGDVVLEALFRSPQRYWSIWTESRRIILQVGQGDVAAARIENNSWSFYDKKNTLLTQLLIGSSGGGNSTLAATLRSDGFVNFVDLDGGRMAILTRVPQDDCDSPEKCKPFQICSGGSGPATCNCPAPLSSSTTCDRPATSFCKPPARSSASFAEIGDAGYFALSFLTTPTFSNSNLASCKSSCLSNCSCVALFFERSARNCFLFDEIGNLRQQPSSDSTGLTTFLKILAQDSGGGGGGGPKKTTIVVVTIAVLTVVIVATILCVALRVHRRRPDPRDPSMPLVHFDDDAGDGDDDGLLEMLPGMPVRYSYQELRQATGEFSNKLGHGGFGCVYSGELPDGSRIAVKKLEGIGQGRKEFRAEVSTIGSIHHVHLVKLRGFCAEGPHRLLAYELMPNGSLDRWIFRQNHDHDHDQNHDPPVVLDWDKRFNIALGTAKGLAYLHEDCASKIIHCDIKPENVLLDANFVAKVSDFGLAKLMTREQSNVFTTLRGTRGYLAPEWIIGSPISEKSDVYSYGMVLLELVAGRKSFDAAAGSEKAHFPSYAFRKLEEGRLEEVVDGRLAKDERVELAVKVALWCIQEDASMRPSMGKVVQMLEGVAEVPSPPLSSQMGYRLYANALKCTSEGGMTTTTTTSSSAAQSDWNSDTYMSAVRLSGPR